LLEEGEEIDYVPLSSHSFRNPHPFIPRFEGEGEKISYLIYFLIVERRKKIISPLSNWKGENLSPTFFVKEEEDRRSRQSIREEKRKKTSSSAQCWVWGKGEEVEAPKGGAGIDTTFY